MDRSVFMVRMLFLLGLCLSFCACSSSHVTINVTSTDATNNNRAVYMVVRKVTSREYLTDSYELVSQKVFAQPEDKSVLLAQPVMPGIDLEVEVKKPEEDSPLAIYFFFTDPGPKWKAFMEIPLADDASFVLGKNSISAEEFD